MGEMEEEGKVLTGFVYRDGILNPWRQALALDQFDEFMTLRACFGKKFNTSCACFLPLCLSVIMEVKEQRCRPLKRIISLASASVHTSVTQLHQEKFQKLLMESCHPSRVSARLSPHEANDLHVRAARSARSHRAPLMYSITGEESASDRNDVWFWLGVLRQSWECSLCILDRSFGTQMVYIRTLHCNEISVSYSPDTYNMLADWSKQMCFPQVVAVD